MKPRRSLFRLMVVLTATAGAIDTASVEPALLAQNDDIQDCVRETRGTSNNRLNCCRQAQRDDRHGK